MLLEVGNVWTLVRTSSDDELHWLRETLAFQDTRKSFQVGPGGRPQYVEPPTVTLLKPPEGTLQGKFPAGLTTHVIQKSVGKLSTEVTVVDGRTKPYEPDLSLMPDYLRPYQREAVEAAVRKTKGLISLPTGCHAKGQCILMFDGAIKAVENIKVGDQLMGPDSTPRTVQQLCRGRQEMVRIIPTKGEPWEVNLDHILTLVRTNDGSKREGEIVDVSVRDWLSWSKTDKHVHKLFRVPCDFPEPEPVRIDPYILGVLLGDGSLTQCIAVHNQDEEVLSACREYADKLGMELREERTSSGCPRVRFVDPTRQSNPLIDAARAEGIWGCKAGTKYIPRRYLTGSRETRLEVLAGLMDTDGSLSSGCFDYISKSQRLADGVAYIARSLGFSAYVKECQKSSQTGFVGTYYRVTISGDIDTISVRVGHKKAPKRLQKKNPLRTGFKVEYLPEAGYYGFSLDGDCRYLLDDFTVTHNTGKAHCAVALANVLSGGTVLATAPEKALAYNLKDRYERLTGTQSGLIGDGHFEIGEGFTAATMQTLAAGLRKGDPKVLEYLESVDVLIQDEVHQSAADSYFGVTMAIPAYWRIGFSGTPLDRGDKRNLYVVASTGSVIYKKTPQYFIERGWLSAPKIKMVEVRQSSQATSWRKSYTQCVVKSRQRNAVGVGMAVQAAKPGFVFVREVAHGKQIEQLCKQAGLRARFIWGDKNMAARDQALKDLEWGDLDVIVCNTVFVTGIDFPELRSIVNLSGMKSIIETLQRLGRGTRVTETKTEFELWDIYDTCPGGPSGQDGNKYNARHSKERERVYVSQGYQVTRVTDFIP